MTHDLVTALRPLLTAEASAEAYSTGTEPGDLEQAVWLMDLHREHWPGWEGEVEVRQIFGPEDFPRPAAGVAAT